MRVFTVIHDLCRWPQPFVSAHKTMMNYNAANDPATTPEIKVDSMHA